MIIMTKKTKATKATTVPAPVTAPVITVDQEVDEFIHFTLSDLQTAATNWIKGTGQGDNAKADFKAHVQELVQECIDHPTYSPVSIYQQGLILVDRGNGDKKYTNKLLSGFRQELDNGSDALECIQKPTFKLVNQKKPESGYEVTWVDRPVKDDIADEIREAFSEYVKIGSAQREAFILVMNSYEAALTERAEIARAGLVTIDNAKAAERADKALTECAAARATDAESLAKMTTAQLAKRAKLEAANG